jgi:hypothetical protein
MLCPESAFCRAVFEGIIRKGCVVWRRESLTADSRALDAQKPIPICIILDASADAVDDLDP